MRRPQNQSGNGGEDSSIESKPSMVLFTTMYYYPLPTLMINSCDWLFMQSSPTPLFHQVFQITFHLPYYKANSTTSKTLTPYSNIFTQNVHHLRLVSSSFFHFSSLIPYKGASNATASLSSQSKDPHIAVQHYTAQPGTTKSPALKKPSSPT
jgi:hypothetical protein